jgi:amino acid transporter
MKLMGVLFLTLSAETPASSVFVIVPDVLTQAGTGALISMLFAALIALCMAQVYAELSSAFPIAGGEYALVGRTLGPLAGFLVLALNLTNTLLGAAVLALGVSDYLGSTIPGLQPIPTALLVIVGSALLGVLNVRTNAFVTGGFLVVEILAVAVLAALGLLHPVRSPLALLAHPQTLSGGTLIPTPAAALGLAVAVAIFAYDGYGGAVYFAEEMHAARRRVGRAIVIALVITLVAELVPLTAMLTGAPDLTRLLGARAVFLDFIDRQGGHALALLLGAAIGLAIVNAVIAIVLLSARQLYSTGRDETWARPVNQLLSQVHPRFGSPWAATVVTGAITCGFCFIPLRLLLIATGTSVAAVYAFLCMGLMAGRATGSTRHGVFRLWGFPLTPITALIALAGVLWSDWLDPRDGRSGLSAALSVAVLSAAYYLVVLRRRGWVLRGPEEEGGVGVGAHQPSSASPHPSASRPPSP